MGIGLVVALGSGEVFVRAHIRAEQRGNSIERLREVSDRAMEAGRESALVHIIRLRDDELLQFELKPDLDMPFKSGSVRTNSVGMCEDREYSVAKPDGALRIVGLGDSGMFGWGVPYDGNYLAVLERNLAASTDDMETEVLNFAIPAINTCMEEAVLQQKAIDYDPDVVVVGWCVNDTSLPNLLVKELALRWDRSYLWMMLTDREAFDEMLTSDVGTSTLVPERVVAPALRRSVGEDAVVASFARMARMGDERGFELFVFGPIDDWLVTALDEQGIPYANTLELLDADDYPEEFRIHAMHPSAEGHRVLGELLERELRRVGFLPST